MPKVTVRDVQQKLRGELSKYSPADVLYNAVLGDGNGNIIVADRAGYIYVRGWDNTPHTVFNDIAPTSPEFEGIPLKIGIRADNPNLVRVIALLNPYIQSTTPGTYIPHTEYEWPSPNMINVYSPAIYPAGVRAKKGTLSVTVLPFVLRMSDGKGKYIVKQDVDLTSHVPTSGAIWVTLSFDQTTGLPVLTDSTSVSSRFLLQALQNAKEPDGSIAIAAVALFAGMSQVTQSATENDIRDLRWNYWYGTGGGGDMLKSTYDTDDDGVVDDSASTRALRGNSIDPTLSPADGHVLKWNAATSQYEDAAESGGLAAFTDIPDVPASYVGYGSDLVSVKSDETGLEFVPPPDPGGDMFKSVYDTNDDGTVDSADFAAAAGDADTLNTHPDTDFEAVANKDTDGTLAANSDTKYPSQKAVKTYADGLWRVYALQVAATVVSPADGATLYWGANPSEPPDTGSGRHQVYVPIDGVLRVAGIRWHSWGGAAGSGEDISIYVRINDTTDLLVATVGSTTLIKDFVNTGLTTAVAAGDRINIKIVCPTWATNPTQVRMSGTLLFITA